MYADFHAKVSAYDAAHVSKLVRASDRVAGNRRSCALAGLAITLITAAASAVFGYCMHAPNFELTFGTFGQNDPRRIAPSLIWPNSSESIRDCVGYGAAFGVFLVVPSLVAVVLLPSRLLRARLRECRWCRLGRATGGEQRVVPVA